MKNPTPKLRELRREAEKAIKKDGRKEAVKSAMMSYAYARTRYGIKDPMTRRFALLVRMMNRMKEMRRKGKTYYDKLIEEYGTADARDVRGFILSDGSCLNLGQYDDHRIIVSVYRDSQQAERKYGSRYGAVKALCKKYNMIRWIPESKMADVFVPTTRQQDDTLRDLADAGYLKAVEVNRPHGGIVMLEAEDGETLVRGINAIFS